MNTINQNYYYAVVDKESGRLILIDGILPIFLTRTIARRKVMGLSNIKILKISGKKIYKVLREAS